MKSLRVVVCLILGLLVLEVMVGQACAELPWTREIRDKVKWGDPDWPFARKRDSGRSAYASNLGVHNDTETWIVDRGTPHLAAVGLRFGVHLFVASPAGVHPNRGNRRDLR